MPYTHHGEALAVVASNVLSYNLRNVSESTVENIDALLKNVKSEKIDLRDRVIDKIEKIISELGLLKNINKYNIDDNMLSIMVKESFNPDMAGNPYEFSEGEIKSILGEI